MAPPKKPQMTMAEFAASVTDIGDSSPSVNLLLYGDPGVGKTTLLSGLPGALMLAFDPGWVTAKRMKRKCDIVVVDSLDKLNAGLNWLEDTGCDNYRWIVADGLSVLQTRLLQQAAREAWEDNPSKRVSQFQPDRPDYFKSQSAIKSAVARLCDLPINVAFTAHSMHAENEYGDSVIRPHIEGKNYQVGNFVNGLMSAVGYMAVTSKGKGDNKKQIRRILWQQFYDDEKGVTYMAKDQLNAFGFVSDDPTPEWLHEKVISEEPEEYL